MDRQQSVGAQEPSDLLTNSLKSTEPINTRAEIARAAGVGENTVKRVKEIEAKATDADKAAQ